MKLAVVIPAYNEETTIGEVLDGIPAKIEGIEEIEKIVINDGSTDQTAKIALEKGAKVISHVKNIGVGRSFQTGIESALKEGADIVVNMDADGQFNPKDIPQLINPILQKKADFVTCTRFASKDYKIEMPKIKRWGNKFMTFLINFITKEKFTDVSCGFRAYSREAILRLNLFGKFTYTQETFLDFSWKGLKMVEVPLKVKGTRKHGKSRVASNLFEYGVRTALIILRSFRDYKPLEFFGRIGLGILVVGVILILIVFINWLATRQTAPYTSFITLGGVALIIGFLLFVIALLADMLDRQRKIQEDTLYLYKKMIYEKNQFLNHQKNKK